MNEQGELGVSAFKVRVARALFDKGVNFRLANTNLTVFVACSTFCNAHFSIFFIRRIRIRARRGQQAVQEVRGRHRRVREKNRNFQ